MPFCLRINAALLALAFSGPGWSVAVTEAPDTESLYEHLYPDASLTPERTPASSSSGRDTARWPGFAAERRRTRWSDEQIEAMRRAFKPPSARRDAEPDDSHLSLASPTVPGPPEAVPYASLVEKYASRYGLDPLLIHQVILAESQYDPWAISPKGAKGLMQLMDEVSETFNIDPFDPESNIQVGTRYLAQMLARFESVELALAAYNAGPGAVEKYQGIPPFAETQNYISRIQGGLVQREAGYP
ncbi:hypothetical protein LCGC14_0393360 [marine sediment metagenome]|uniref:Lytic transglycosylase domain-containing protein n=3 Tax=root TaxID=1 RepID=A0A7V1FQT8_9GAMM|nr:lytic transglycosylase domain-containing protein [Marinobacter antarcticus]HDZ55291.1 lytic transglycosylase domain-containing protein [Halopseudomonas xinjiangensis]HEA51679.1 lytic transglycosylase domain-containing protein [Marinobacter antarcticus]